MTPYRYIGRVLDAHMAWDVEGPDGVVGTFRGADARETAEKLVSLLNRAFELGVSKVLRQTAEGG